MTHMTHAPSTHTHDTHRTPHTAHRTPHTAHRTPHTAHRTPHTTTPPHHHTTTPPHHHTTTPPHTTPPHHHTTGSFRGSDGSRGGERERERQKRKKDKQKQTQNHRTTRQCGHVRPILASSPHSRVSQCLFFSCTSASLVTVQCAHLSDHSSNVHAWLKDRLEKRHIYPHVNINPSQYVSHGSGAFDHWPC